MIIVMVMILILSGVGNGMGIVGAWTDCCVSLAGFWLLAQRIGFSSSCSVGRHHQALEN